MSVTLKFQSTGTVPGSGAPVPMQGGSITIGRGAGNDLVLPDPDRVISNRHCVIEDHNGNVVIIDLSTNGTFLNYSKIPLGNIPTPLNDGDVLSMGSYELVVEIRPDNAETSDVIAPPLEQDVVSHGSAANAPDPLALLDDAPPGGKDFLDDLLGSPEGPVGPSQLKSEDPINELLPPLGEEEDPFFQKPSDGMEATGASDPMHNPSPTDSFSAPAASSNLIPDDWDDELLGTGTPAPAADPADAPIPPATPPIPPVTPPIPDPIPDPGAPPDPLAGAPIPPAAQPTPQPVPEPAPPVAGAAPAGPEAAARAFLKSVGADHLNIDDAELQSTMVRMGTVLKAMITGLREILMTRSSIKSEFRIDQTMISAGGNNPLKFSISPEQAIEAMIKPTTRGYLEAGEATEQALNDIKAHEVAMVTGMEAALKGVLQRLDPKVLNEKIEGARGLGALIKGRKALSWEVYEKMYGEISDQAENDFHELFAKEFARAYKEQLEKLK